MKYDRAVEQSKSRCFVLVVVVSFRFVFCVSFDWSPSSSSSHWKAAKYDNKIQRPSSAAGRAQAKGESHLFIVVIFLCCAERAAVAAAAWRKRRRISSSIAVDMNKVGLVVGSQTDDGKGERKWSQDEAIRRGGCVEIVLWRLFASYQQPFRPVAPWWRKKGEEDVLLTNSIYINQINVVAHKMGPIHYFVCAAPLPRENALAREIYAKPLLPLDVFMTVLTSRRWSLIQKY